MMPETLLFALVVLSFVVPLIIAYTLYAYVRMPAILKVLIVMIGILFIAIVQYSWYGLHGSGFLDWWTMYLPIIVIGTLVATILSI